MAQSLVRCVVLVSFDGGKPSVMQASAMPNLKRLIREGAHSWQAQTIVPPVTLPSHTSMLTGVGPDKHKVLWNDWEPERGMVAMPTIHSLATKERLKSAMFVGKSKFIHLFIPDSMDVFSYPAYGALQVARTAAEYIQTERPNLVFVHFADSDGTGHQYGWGSEQQKRAFADEDRALGILLDGVRRGGLLRDSVFLLSADHGGHEKSHGLDIPDDREIPWIAWGKGIARGKVLSSPISTFDTAATALHLLGTPIPSHFDGKPVLEALQAS
jgi:predicted AlkP superfamily pyrophosphatase or phosphodiesterase